MSNKPLTPEEIWAAAQPLKGFTVKGNITGNGGPFFFSYDPATGGQDIGLNPGTNSHHLISYSGEFVPDTQRSVTPPVNPTVEARAFIEKWAKLHDVNFTIAGGDGYLTVTFKGKVEVLQAKLDPANREELKSTLYDMVYG